MKKMRYFTLTELLVVVAIIAVLAGIALPVVSRAAQKGKQTQARTEMNALELAFSEFERDYGSLRALPGFTGLDSLGSDKKIVTSVRPTAVNNAYDAIMVTMTYTPIDGTAVTSATQLPGGSLKLTDYNKKKKVYYRPPAKNIKDARFKSNGEADPTNDVYGFFILDPWGKRYNIAFDYNGDNIINASGFGGETGDVRGKILIFSYGHETDDNVKNYVSSWKRR